jgi:peroxiredoxin Q/BCP
MIRYQENDKTFLDYEFSFQPNPGDVVSQDSPELTKMVPDFTASMTGGADFNLIAQRGKNLVLYFYPKDNTPGCTAEAINFRDLYSRFQAANTEIVGVSRDSMRSHEGFKTKFGLPFELISDPDELLCNRFGVMKIKNMYGKKVRGIERSTFLIDDSGRLVKEWRGLKVPGHIDDVLAFIESSA